MISPTGLTLAFSFIRMASDSEIKKMYQMCHSQNKIQTIPYLLSRKDISWRLYEVTETILHRPLHARRELWKKNVGCHSRTFFSVCTFPWNWIPIPFFLFSTLFSPDSIENKASVIHLQGHSKEFRYIMLWGKKNHLRCILMLLYYFKINQIDIHYWDTP